MAQLQTPPGTEPSAEAGQTDPLPEPQPGEGRRLPRLRSRMARYRDLENHELITLLDEVDDERAKARFREAVYISVIVWLVLGWVMVYGPRYLWHAPVIVAAVPDKRNEMTYLDVPPDLQKQLQRQRPTPNISRQSTEAQSPKPAPRAPEPRAGTPAPPAARPAPQPQQRQPAPQQQPAPQPQQQPAPQSQQQARNTPPTPQPSRIPPPVADAPAPSPSQPNRNIFGTPQSARDQIQQAARGARGSAGGESGDYGSTGRGQPAGGKMGTEILSDTQGVDFGKYLQRLLSDVRRNWLPLIPEECRPPLNKQGITGVRFTIQPNGVISAMHLDYSTHDVAVDRAAWGSITALGAAQPLPKEFHGPNLELRIEFRINKDGQSEAQ